MMKQQFNTQNWFFQSENTAIGWGLNNQDIKRRDSNNENLYTIARQGRQIFQHPGFSAYPAAITVVYTHAPKCRKVVDSRPGISDGFEELDRQQLEVDARITCANKIAPRGPSFYAGV